MLDYFVEYCELAVEMAPTLWEKVRRSNTLKQLKCEIVALVYFGKVEICLHVTMDNKVN